MTRRPKLVVGIDGTSRGEDALALARELASIAGTTLLLTHVYSTDESRDEAHAIVDAAVATVEDETAVYWDGSPARGLGRVAATYGAALIVLGPSRRSGLGIVVPGTTAQRLLHDGRRAVAVAPAGWRPQAEPRPWLIGCAFDGSAEANAALRFATELEQECAGTLEVIRSFWSPSLSGPGGVAAAADLQARAQTGLGEAVQALPAELHAEATVLLNDPARALTRHSRTLDLLVTGSRGHGPIGALWDGSVSGEVMREASCPVVVVPRGIHPPLFEPA